MKILISIFFITSCSSLISGADPDQKKTTYSYIDASGKWGQTREYKNLGKKLVTRSIIGPYSNPNIKSLEKSITVSQVGTLKGKKGRFTTVRPFASDYSVWLEGKEYKSKLKIDPKTKSMVVVLDSPDTKWKGQSRIPFPKGDQFCFFSQLPECLHFNQLLYRAQERPGVNVSLQVVWDGYPYSQELYGGMGASLFSPAVLSFKGEIQGSFHFELEVDGQTILYHFSKAHDLVRMFWIAQGITVLPQGEDMQDVE